MGIHEERVARGARVFGHVRTARPFAPVRYLVDGAIRKSEPATRAARVLAARDRAVSTAELAASALPSEGVCPLPEIVPGLSLSAVLVNIVYRSRIVAAPDAQVTSLPLLPLRARLLNIVSFKRKQTAGASFHVAYRAPYRATLDVGPLDLSLQETAATSVATSAVTLRATLSLLALDGSRPEPTVRDRKCHNQVYTTYVPFDVDTAAFLKAHSVWGTRPQRFDGVIITHPQLGKMKLMVIATGIIICVGSKETGDMVRAVSRFIEPIHACRRERLLA